MQKTKIDWCDMSFNPVTGCLHNCQYCYARKIANRFGTEWFPNTKCVELEKPVMVPNGNGKDRINPYPHMFAPTFHKYRLEEPSKKKKGQTIFVCSMADLFGDWVPDEWINEIMKSIAKAPQHRYLFLTKNPERYYEYTEGAWQSLPEEYDFTKVNILAYGSLSGLWGLKTSLGAEEFGKIMIQILKLAAK